jgi:hypothetical protein
MEKKIIKKENYIYTYIFHMLKKIIFWKKKLFVFSMCKLTLGYPTSRSSTSQSLLITPFVGGWGGRGACLLWLGI